MKILFIAAEIEIVSMSPWIDEFRKKYDEPHPYHITLKYPSWIDDSEVSLAKDKFFEITKEISVLKLEFSEIRFGETDNGFLIMLDTRDSKQLSDLQRKILRTYRKVGRIFKESYLDYEDDFKPHITIARHMSKEILEKAKLELKEPIIKAKISTIVLTIVPEMELELMADPKNRYVSKLNISK